LQTSQIDSTISVIKKKPEINGNAIKVVSKQDIAKEFLNSSHENFDELLGDVNPFKNLIVLEFNPDYRNKKTFDKIANELKVLPSIYEVSYPVNYMDLIIPKIKVISSAALIFIGLIALIVYLQISNYTKLHIHANRNLIKSMQLLGSTNGFIMKPYLLKSVIHGLSGALVGFILTNLFYFYLNNQIPELTDYLYNTNNQLIILIGTIFVSILFSFISTLITVNRYLRISASNLY
ncbi:cell division protein FtsX, partial [Aquirufa sp.]|uniref:cell division protein FtsX n=1 Tax=Aquirufa sp. TaxID=2676249 RepID=UPI0037BF8D96